MTMPTDAAKPPRQFYLENGVTTVHAIDFNFIDAADITVVRILADGTELELAQPIDYTVTGGGFGAGAITKANGGTAGASIRIDRNTKRDQALDFVAGDAFSEEGVEHGFDRLTMIVQELERDQLSAADVRNIVAEQLVAGEGIGLELGAGNETLTITNLFSAEYVRDTLAAALVAGSGILITPNDADDKITISVSEELAGTLADTLLLSGDQQSGGSAGTGAGTFAEQVIDLVAAAIVGAIYDDAAGTITVPGGAGGLTAEEVRDLIGAALIGAGGITITPNDAGDQIEVGVAGGSVDAEFIRDTLGSAFVAGSGITIAVNDAGDTITISSTALDASYKGIVPSGRAASFDFSDAMNARATDWTGAAGVATIKLESDVALADGWVHRIRNNGTGNLTIKRDTAGVSLAKNGATVSADALLAPGGTAFLERWDADDFTVTGTKLT